MSELLVYIIGSSLSFFVVFPWFARIANVHLALTAYSVFIVSMLVIFINRKTISLKIINWDRTEFYILAVFLIILALRCLPMDLQIVPAGGDMSMHAYIARLIYNNDSIPSSYEPLLPISRFGAYPTGFPTISAFISLLSSMPVYRSSLLVSCFSHFLFTLGLYVFLLRFFDKRSSAAAAVAASFLTRSPQWIIRWGGNPTVLALFFFMLAFSLMLEIKEKRSNVNILLASLMLAATFITHSIIFYAGGIFILLYFLSTLKENSEILWSLPPMIILFILFMAPYAINLSFTLTSAAMASTRAWQAVDIRSVLYDTITGLPFILLSITGFIISYPKDRKMLMPFIIACIALVLVILNYRIWILPFSYLLYPGRVALLFIIPLSIFSAPVFPGINSSGKRYVLLLLIMIGSIYYGGFYLFNSVSMCPVTSSDIKAFSWIDKNLSSKAVFINNYGDAGLWIPAVINRTILDPHTEPVNTEELKKGLNKIKPGYIYIGNKAVYNIRISKEDLESKPWKYKKIYSIGGSQVWEIL